jgi:glycerol dehydrogenase-like iron-containing ADH family enzyme
MSDNSIPGSALRGIGDIIANVLAAVNPHGALIPGYAPRIAAAIAAVSTLELSVSQAIAGGREVLDADLDGAADAVDALNSAFGAALAAGDNNTAWTCFAAAHRLQSATKLPLWLMLLSQ